MNFLIALQILFFACDAVVCGILAWLRFDMAIRFGARHYAISGLFWLALAIVWACFVYYFIPLAFS